MSDDRPDTGAGDHTLDGPRAPAPLPRGSVGGPTGSFEPVEVVKFGWECVKREPMSIVVALVFTALVAIVPVIGTVVKQVLVVGMRAATREASSARDVMEVSTLLAQFGIDFVINLVNTLPAAYLTMGATVYALKVVRGQRGDISDLFQPTTRFVPMLIAVVCALLGTYIGLALCLIPGIIFALGVQLYPYVVMERGLGGIDALKESWNLTSGHKLDLFVYWLLVALLYIAGVCACGVGVLVVIPITWFALAKIYLQLVGDGSDVASAF